MKLSPKQLWARIIIGLAALLVVMSVVVGFWDVPVSFDRIVNVASAIFGILACGIPTAWLLNRNE
jgi:membrane associated rhomboid family serine protease